MYKVLTSHITYYMYNMFYLFIIFTYLKKNWKQLCKLFRRQAPGSIWKYKSFVYIKDFYFLIRDYHHSDVCIIHAWLGQSYRTVQIWGHYILNTFLGHRMLFTSARYTVKGKWRTIWYQNFKCWAFEKWCFIGYLLRTGTTVCIL